MLLQLDIKGLRGFVSNERFSPAVAGGKDALGLTIIVGANNTGKSTVIEALRAIVQLRPPSFSQGRRNHAAGDQVRIGARSTEDKERVIESIRSGTSESKFSKSEMTGLNEKIFVLPSRRVFSPYFGKGEANRSSYMENIGFSTIRSAQLDPFTSRLFRIEKEPEKFNDLMAEVIGSKIRWSIDQSDQGQHFLKIETAAGATHSSEGMGEGLVSLMYIIDALYDSQPGQTIAIDEPELSLHPQFQRRLQRMFLRYAEDRQIILSTHSPYFLDVSALDRGVRVYRTSSGKDGSKLHVLSDETAKKIANFANNANNPHIVGIAAREAFFADDNIVLLEGQEDVIFLEKALSDVGMTLQGSYFGWGVGGAGNMKVIASMLKELGFHKVVGILDNDQATTRDALAKEFSGFHFALQPAKDIRTKQARDAVAKTSGLLTDDNRQVRPEHKTAFKEIIVSANKYLETD